MVTSNAEIEASGIRRDKETSKRGVNSKQRRGVGQPSSEVGCKSLAVNRNDWSWRNLINSYGQANIGGILNRLILNTQNLINESEERTADLKEQLAELEQISREFFKEDSE